VATVQDLARELRRVLDLLDQATTHAARAAADLDGSLASWTRLMSSSAAPESGQVAASLTSSAGRVDKARAALTTATTLVQRYLQHILGPQEPATHVQPRPSRTPGHRPLPERISESRARVGARPTRTPTSGEWVRSDGATLRINSGDSDRWYPEVVAFIRTRLPERYRRALAVATHCEAKVAIAMRDGWTDSENVVVDKTVCGTRTFDSHQMWTCDKLLPVLLPPGARLTVMQGDGTARTYVGDRDPV
jgi:hypothetical protein